MTAQNTATVPMAQAARPRAGQWAIGISVILFIAAFLASIGVGAVDLSLGQVISILFGQIGLDLPWTYADGQAAVVTEIRLPRAVMGSMVGMCLALAGAALQGFFRNPLADPTLVGVSSGSALAAVALIVGGGALVGELPPSLRHFALPITAFVGGIIATLLVYQIAQSAGRTVVSTMLLAGIAIQAITAAGIGIFVFLSDDDALRQLNFWLLGSLGGASWDLLLPAMPLLLAPVLLLPRLARPLNAFLLGEAEAGHLGVDTERFKRWLIVLVALAAGAAVAVSGIIGFVGLVVPHIIRLLIGPNHRILLPAAAFLGAALLLAADILARTIVAPAELPIGILTSLIGGPFFLWLLLRQRWGVSG